MGPSVCELPEVPDLKERVISSVDFVVPWNNQNGHPQSRVRPHFSGAAAPNLHGRAGTNLPEL